MLLAPISNPRNVLDIGTGVGLWATYVFIVSLCFLSEC